MWLDQTGRHSEPYAVRLELMGKMATMRRSKKFHDRGRHFTCEGQGGTRGKKCTDIHSALEDSV